MELQPKYVGFSKSQIESSTQDAVTVHLMTNEPMHASRETSSTRASREAMGLYDYVLSLRCATKPVAYVWISQTASGMALPPMTVSRRTTQGGPFEVTSRPSAAP